MQRQWLHSPEPQFRQKVNAICALYRQAPKGSVVLSVDEKTGIQAIERKHADRAPAPGRARRREFEYVRHGTQSVIAALDVHTGRVMGSCTDRRTQADLVTFMEQVALAHPKGRVHIAWDNLITHRAQSVWDDFSARHANRIVFHFTRLHASWVNQIELLFDIYTTPRPALRQSFVHRAIARTHGSLHGATQPGTPGTPGTPGIQMDITGFELQTGEPLRFKHNANVRSTTKGR